MTQLLVRIATPLLFSLYSRVITHSQENEHRVIIKSKILETI